MRRANSPFFARQLFRSRAKVLPAQKLASHLADELFRAAQIHRPSRNPSAWLLSMSFHSSKSLIFALLPIFQLLHRQSSVRDAYLMGRTTVSKTERPRCRLKSARNSAAKLSCSSCKNKERVRGEPLLEIRYFNEKTLLSLSLPTSVAIYLLSFQLYLKLQKFTCYVTLLARNFSPNNIFLSSVLRSNFFLQVKTPIERTHYFFSKLEYFNLPIQAPHSCLKFSKTNKYAPKFFASKRTELRFYIVTFSFSLPPYVCNCSCVHVL